MKYIIIVLIAVMSAGYVQAQTGVAPAMDTIKINRYDKPGLNPGFANGGALNKQKKGSSIWLGSGGVHYDNGKPDSTDHAFEVQYGMLDLGINNLVDNTDYSQVPIGVLGMTYITAPHQTKDLFALRQGKSINVNVYPIMIKARLYKSARQRITLASGIGLQLYNFRFTKPVSYISNPGPYVAVDTISFSKNKLAFNYLTIPLMINGKTKIASNPNLIKAGESKGKSYGGGYWLTYGVGISGGYLLSSWTKQISDERGKDKNHDPFNFRKTNLCVNGEIGLDGYIRLYASYQLTALHEDRLDQHPFCIGVRFFGL